MADNYYSPQVGYTYNPIKYINSKDMFPFRNQWRSNPLSNQSIIKPNVAGYYPYPTRWVKSTPKLTPDYEYKWQYVCSTIFPSSPEYEKNPEPILFR